MLKKDQTGQYWYELLGQLGLSGIEAELARNCIFESYKADKVVLRLDPAFENFCLEGAKDALQKGLEKYFSQSLTLHIRMIQNSIETPAERMFRESKAKQGLLEQTMLNDKLVKMLQTQFDAQIVRGSIKSNEAIEEFS